MQQIIKDTVRENIFFYDIKYLYGRYLIDFYDIKYLPFARPLIRDMQTVCVTDRQADKIRGETESLTWTMAASVLCSIKTFHEEHDMCQYSKFPFPARPARERERDRVSEDIGE